MLQHAASTGPVPIPDSTIQLALDRKVFLAVQPRTARRPLGSRKVLELLQPVAAVSRPSRRTRIRWASERRSEAAVEGLDVSWLAGSRHTETLAGFWMSLFRTTAAVTAETALQDVRTLTPALRRRSSNAYIASA